jgi:hypothetical protein
MLMLLPLLQGGKAPILPLKRTENSPYPYNRTAADPMPNRQGKYKAWPTQAVPAGLGNFFAATAQKAVGHD